MKRAAWNARNNASIKEIDDFKPAFNNASSNCDYKEKFEQNYEKIVTISDF